MAAEVCCELSLHTKITNKGERRSSELSTPSNLSDIMLLFSAK